MAEPAVGAARKLIDALREGATPIDSGHFGLDPKRAAEQLSEFRYPEPHHYLVHLIEGCLALGAETIDVDTPLGNLSIHARGVELADAADALGILYAHALGWQGEGVVARGLSRLGIGVDMALAHGRVDDLLIVHDEPGSLATVAVFEDRAPPRLYTQPSGIGGVRILIDRDWRETLEDGDPVVEALRDAVRHSTAAVRIDGESVSGQPRPLDLGLVERTPQWWVRVGLVTEGEPRSCQEIWSSGVRIQRDPLEGIGILAEIHVVAPRRDLSQRSVVQDEAMVRATEVVSRFADSVQAHLASHDAGWTPQTRPANWPVERVDRVLGRAPAKQDEGWKATAEASTKVRDRAGLQGMAISLLAGLGVNFVLATPWALGGGLVRWVVAVALLGLGVQGVRRAARYEDRDGPGGTAFIFGGWLAGLTLFGLFGVSVLL